MTKRTLYAAPPMYAPALAVLLLSCMFAAAPLAAGMPRTEVAQGGAAHPPCGACIAIVLTPEQVRLLPGRLDGLEILVHAAPAADPAAAEAVAAIGLNGGHPGLIVDGIPAADLPAAVVAGLERLLIDLGNPAAGQDPAQMAYTLKLRITAARASVRRDLAVGITGPPEMLAALAAPDLEPYVDFVVWRGEPPAGDRRERWRALEDGRALGDALRATQSPSAQRWLWRLPEAVSGPPFSDLVRDLIRAAALLPAGLVPVPAVQLTCSGVHADSFLDPQTLDTLALVHGCPADAPIVVTPARPGVERVTLSSDDSIVRVPHGPEGAFAEGVQVVGSRTLAVEEIIARHQAQAARQAAAVRQLITHGTLTLTFEAPGFPAPVAISSEAIIYASGGTTELEQREVRVNGLRFTGGAVPRLPIIEPERVASPPLAISLTGLYRYRLDGRDTVDGTGCYVVAFEPLGGEPRGGRAASLFRGRAWIAMDSFAMVKVAAAQTGLRGPIVASEQADTFRDAGGGNWLLSHSEVRQMYEGAAHRTPIHRVLAVAAQEINPPDFAGRLQSAYRSDSLMLRDTPQGYRYLRKDAQSGGAGPAASPAIAQRSDRVRAIVGGLIVDPNISFPLPFAGFSYVDFNWFDTGTELNAFFGGTYAQLAFSVPSIHRTRWQLAGRAFGIASSYNDRAFVGGIEQYDENVRQRPAQAAIWLHRAWTPRIAMRIGYDLDYTHLESAPGTASGFVVPADQVVHGARVALDAQREGWNASVWWNPARRSGWRAWGNAASRDYQPAQRDFQRYGASLTHSAVLTPRLVARLEGAWMAGRDLDRFSRYSFGTFDNRLRGYPSALIRYDRGGVLRSAIAWAAGSGVRLDGFLDSAAVHDPGFGRGLRNYTGVGGAVEAPAPFGTLLALEWGYGLRGVNGDGSLGTQVLRVSGYKMF